jgi:carbon starvation protein
VDLLELLGRVAGWVFWLAGVAAVGSAGLSMLYLALGDRDRAVTLFKGSMAAILVAAFGQNVLLSVIASLGGWSTWSAQAGQVAGYPGAGTAIYVMAFILLLLAAINLARGHVAEGGWMIIGSVLALAVVVFATQAFGTTVMQYGGGPLLVEARTDKTYYQPNEQVFLYVTVRASGLAVSTVDLTIDWGDGTTATVRGVPVGREVKICQSGNRWIHVNPSDTRCQGKTYAVSGNEERYFTIQVTAEARVGGNRLAGTTFVTVYVRELPGLSFPFSFLGGILAWIASKLSMGALDPTKLFYAPTFRMDGPEGEWYKTSLKIAVGLLPVFMLFRIAPGLAYSPGAAIVDGFRDAAIAVLAMMLIPHAYNVTAGALNAFTEALMGPAGAAIVSQMAGTAIAWGIFFMIISFFSPGAGFLGFALLATVFLITALIVVRWFIILASVAASPFLVLAWMHPALRGAAESVKGLVASMLVAGPLAAIFTLLFAKVMLGDNPWQQLGASFVLSWLGIFIIGMLPQILSGLAVTSLERTVAGKLETRTMQGAPQVGKAVTAAGARGLAAGATAAGTAAYAKAMRVKPIADAMRAGGAMIGRAREAVSRTLDRVQSGLEGRLSKAQQTLTRDQARLATWKELEGDFGKLATLDSAYREAERAHADSLEYLDSLSAEERANPENAVGLFLNQAEHERLRNEREVERMLLDTKIRHLRERNHLTGDEYRTLETGVREAGAAPALALQYAKKRLEELEQQAEADRAELRKEEIIDKPLIGAIETARGLPRRIAQNFRQMTSRWFGPRVEEGRAP